MMICPSDVMVAALISPPFFYSIRRKSPIQSGSFLGTRYRSGNRGNGGIVASVRYSQQLPASRQAYSSSRDAHADSREHTPCVRFRTRSLASGRAFASGPELPRLPKWAVARGRSSTEPARCTAKASLIFCRSRQTPGFARTSASTKAWKVRVRATWAAPSIRTGVVELRGNMKTSSNGTVWQSSMIAVMQNVTLRYANRLTLNGSLEEEGASMAFRSLGVSTARFPFDTVKQVLCVTERTSQRERDLPAHVMVYYAIALARYAIVSTREVLRCVLEGVRWLGEPGTVAEPAGPSGISQAPHPPGRRATGTAMVGAWTARRSRCGSSRERCPARPRRGRATASLRRSSRLTTGPPMSWPRAITSAGRSRPRSTRARRIGAAPGACCGARPRSWCGKSRGDFSSRTSPFAR